MTEFTSSRRTTTRLLRFAFASRRTRSIGLRIGGLVLGCALSLAPALPAGASGGAKDLALTWSEGFVYYQSDGLISAGRIGDNLQELAELPVGVPVVVYMHGCAGIDQSTTATAKFYADNGYAVVIPDSFARTAKPASCDPETHRGGLHREVLGWRQSELALAIENIRRLPGGANRPLVLHGFSEGAITVATFKGKQRHTARIVEGWTCHSLWPEYKGLKAARHVDTLALVGERDPWFRQSYLQGDCGAFMSSARHHSVVFTGNHPLAGKHYLVWHKSVRKTVMEFLATSLRSSR